MHKKSKLEKSSFYISLAKDHFKHFNNIEILKRELTSKEDYVSNAFKYTVRTITTFSQLETTKLFLFQSANPKADFKKLKIGRGAYFRYHLEYYYIKLLTIKDVVIKLINRVYQFNHFENNSLERKILADLKKINEIAVENWVKLFLAFLKPLAQIRNEIAHGSHFKNNFLVMVEAEDLFRANKDYNTVRKFKKEYQQSFFFVFYNEIKEIEKNEKLITKNIELLFRLLNPIRKKNYKEL